MAIDIRKFVRDYAASIGMDPDVALKVVGGEGGFSDPYQHGRGPAPESQAAGLGSTENSYGPMQLYISGTGAGLGDRALAAGIDPRTDWQAGTRFGLDEAKRAGWGQWYGAKAAGITGFEGINGTPLSGPRPGMNLTSIPGQAPPPLPPPINVGDMPVSTAPVAGSDAPAAPPTDLMAAITKLTEPTGKDGTGASQLGALAKAFSPPAPQADPIIQTGALQSSDAMDQARMANAQQLMQSLITKRKQKMPGFGLNGMMG